MRPEHPLVALLRLHDAGVLPASSIDVLLDEHMAETSEGPVSGQPRGPEETFFVEHLLARAPDAYGDRRRAETDLRVLLALGEAEQQHVVAKARSRYNSPLLAARLLDHCRAVVHEDPEEAAGCARIAGMVAYRAEDLVLEPLSRAMLANALRAGGDLIAADHQFEAARRLLRLAPPDATAEAELDSLEASLRRDQRRFEDARMLLQRAALLFASLGLNQREATVRLNRAEVHRMTGNVEAAVSDVVVCLGLLEPRRTPSLHAFALHALALSLLSAGRQDEAAQLVKLLRPFFEREGGELLRLRLDWLEGRIAVAYGDLQTARERLGAALSGFASYRQPLTAAVVALDLAEVLVAEGRADFLREFAEKLATTFRGQRLEGEAAKVVQLLWRSAAQQSLSVTVVQKLRARVSPMAGR